MSQSATPATQSAATCLQVPRLPHAKCSYMSPSATPATQVPRKCHASATQVPRLPRCVSKLCVQFVCEQVVCEQVVCVCVRASSV